VAIVITCQPLQNLPRVAVTRPVDPANKLDDIAAAAAREAAPEILAAADHKGGRVVAAMERAWADEVISSNSKTAE